MEEKIKKLGNYIDNLRIIKNYIK